MLLICEINFITSHCTVSNLYAVFGGHPAPYRASRLEIPPSDKFTSEIILDCLSLRTFNKCFFHGVSSPSVHLFRLTEFPPLLSKISSDRLIYICTSSAPTLLQQSSPAIGANFALFLRERTINMLLFLFLASLEASLVREISSISQGQVCWGWASPWGQRSQPNVENVISLPDQD